ncbi:hypothetical protein [Pseudomonas oryzicola]|uniref:Uncharacterized protein n=1 Tax=Pseudomonas oryzicola TaxID=485876 RepID=A0ABS6Q4D4_9PSED|nr:hypothetical protein [Pseudomonas oryzicola]MBV4489057.1 hypothetical protein [Pseudomonas oryzicola]
MNDATFDAKALELVNADCRIKDPCSRLRLGSLIPLVLGVCVLLPATSSSLQAKEISMPENHGQYQPYTPDMKGPEGAFPPMQGYTSAELVTAACQSVERVFKENNLDPTLARESLFDLFNHLTAAYQSEAVDYQISTWYQKPYDDPSARAESVKAMAKEFNAFTIRAAGDALIKSPLNNLSRDFKRSYLESAGNSIQSLIETLNTPAI